MTPEMKQALADALTAIFGSQGISQTVDATPESLIAAFDTVENLLVPGETPAEGAATMSTENMLAVKTALGIKATATEDEVVAHCAAIKSTIGAAGKFGNGIAQLGSAMKGLTNTTRHNGSGRGSAADESGDEMDKNTGDKASKRYNGSGGQQGKRFGRNSLSEALVHMANGNTKALKALGYTAGANGGWLANRETADALIEIFYAEAVVIAAGATVVPMDGVETLTYNKMLTGTSAKWGGEGQTTTDNDPTFGTVQLNLRELVAPIKVANRLLRNASVNLEQVVTGDIEKAMRLAADLAYLRGDGSKPAGHAGHQPLGVRYTTGVNVQAIATNGKIPAPTDFINAWGRIEDANVPLSNSWGLVCSPRTKRTVMNTTDTTGQLIPEERFTQGYGVHATTQISNTLTEGSSGAVTSEAYFGAWEYLIIGMGADVEMTVDTSRYINERQTLFQAVMLTDGAVSQPAAFQVLTGLKA